MSSGGALTTYFLLIGLNIIHFGPVHNYVVSKLASGIRTCGDRTSGGPPVPLLGNSYKIAIL
jgi:hypothetical protein